MEEKNYNFEYYRQYYEKNKEKYVENHKKWVSQNREHWNEYQRKKARLRFWTKRLEENPEDEKAKLKLQAILNEKEKN